AGRIRDAQSAPREVRIARRREFRFAGMRVAAARVGLPYLDDRIRDPTPVLVDDTPRDDGPLSDGCAPPRVRREVRVVGREIRVRRPRTGDLRQCLRDHDAVEGRRTLRGRFVVGKEERWMVGRGPRAVAVHFARPPRRSFAFAIAELAAGTPAYTATCRST